MSETANAEFDEDGNLANADEVEAAFAQLAIDAGVDPQLAATTFVAGRSSIETDVRITEEPGTLMDR